MLARCHREGHGWGRGGIKDGHGRFAALATLHVEIRRIGGARKDSNLDLLIKRRPFHL
jgi:hypothetical protein